MNSTRKCECISSTHGHLTRECSNQAEIGKYCIYCAEHSGNSAFVVNWVANSPEKLPQDLLDEYSEVEKMFINALQVIDPSIIEESFLLWEKLYEKIKKAQPEGIRFHKGGEVHNMGICKYYTLQTIEAFRFFMLGYIEDLLSENVEVANKAPGETNLKEIFKVSEIEFKKIQQCVQDTIKKKGVVQDPQDILDHFSEFKIYEDLEKKIKKISLLIRPNRYLSVSHLPDEWEKRVFIGGDYESLYALDSIISPVVEFGFRPIIAMEFKTPQDRIHHDALLLLHNCKFAIFDVSSKGGHMMEAERTLDYDTETLFVCKKEEEPRVSAMLMSLGKKYEIHWYVNRKELKKHIFDFLKPSTLNG